jgi:hypothetical protein
LQSKRWSRRFGWGLLACGLFISGLMGAVIFATLPKLLHACDPAGSVEYSGTPEQARLVLAILATVELFGLTCLCYGAWQIATGRRSKRVIYFAIGLVMLLWLFALWL